MSRPKPTLNPGDYVFLAFLSGGSLSAYDIKGLMASSVSFFWSAAHSQVYQQAARLLRDGYLAEVATVDPRGRRLLALTPDGQGALSAWLGPPAPPRRTPRPGLRPVPRQAVCRPRGRAGRPRRDAGRPAPPARGAPGRVRGHP